ncbi:MAG: hypothetical protein JNK21_11395 [Rhodospirillaceae bacterium]|nr:hypothetical protein [Rhodospirillaceae bacterium]
MSTAVLALCWALFSGVVFVLVTRPWKSAVNRLPWALGPGLVAMAWVLGTGTAAMSDMMAEGRWTGATLTIPIVPLKALLFGFLAYYCGRGVVAARASQGTMAQRWATPAVLAVALAYLFVGDVIAVRGFNLERQAKRADLSEPEIERIAARVRQGRATSDEATAFIANPLCPDDVREGAVTNADQYVRLAAARNSKLSMDNLLKLSQDPEYQVRLYTIYSDRLPPEALTRLVEDANEYVREALTWRKELPDDLFQRLTTDTSSRVRAAAALQPRIADDDLKRLLADADQSVQREARRAADNRGWE